MGTVNIGIGHDNNFMIAQFTDIILAGTDACT